MAGAPQGGNIWKSIIIGILTTVAAYVIVHFIFDKKDKSKERKKKQEKIETAWKSVNDYINNSRHKFSTISCFSCESDQMKRELLRELDQMNKSLENIKGDPELDEKMKTIIDRTIQMFRDEKPILEIYYDSIKVVRTLPELERTPILQRLQKVMMEQMIRVQTMDTSEINQYLADLNKKYKVNLVKTDPKPVVNADELPGRWKVECEFDMNFKKDNTLEVSYKGEETKGTWSLEDKVLTIDYPDGTRDKFVFIQLNDNVMMIFNQDTKMLLGGCKQ